MPSFPYVARTSHGTLERGTIDAPSIEQAKKQIHNKGWTIEEIAGNTIIGFEEAPAWTTTEETPQPTSSSIVRSDAEIVYIPLMQTLRLFAGWLMAWYGIIYLAGTYRADGRLPYDIPLIQSLASSDLVLRFSFAVFLFLLLGDVHVWLGKKSIIGALLTITGIVTMWIFHVNV